MTPAEIARADARRTAEAIVGQENMTGCYMLVAAIAETILRTSALPELVEAAHVGLKYAPTSEYHDPNATCLRALHIAEHGRDGK